MFCGSTTLEADAVEVAHLDRVSPVGVDGSFNSWIPLGQVACGLRMFLESCGQRRLLGLPFVSGECGYPAAKESLALVQKCFVGVEESTRWAER